MQFRADVAVVLDDFAPCGWEAMALLRHAKCLAPTVCAVALGHERPVGVLYPFSWADKTAMLDALWAWVGPEEGQAVLHKRALVDVAYDAALSAKRLKTLIHKLVCDVQNADAQPGNILKVVCLCSVANFSCVQSWLQYLNECSVDLESVSSMVFVLVEPIHDAVHSGFDFSPRDLREMALGLKQLPESLPWPKSVQDYLSCDWLVKRTLELKQECNAMVTHRAIWQLAPYPPILVTVDALVYCHGFVLLVQRGRAPGYGHWAWPGGFVEQNESLLQSCVRELHEETQLNVDVHTLERALIHAQVFDSPARSARGRVITHVFGFNLSGFFVLSEAGVNQGDACLQTKCPAIAGADDAMAARWVSIETFLNMRSWMHDDHHDIGLVMFEKMNLVSK